MIVWVSRKAYSSLIQLSCQKICSVFIRWNYESLVLTNFIKTLTLIVLYVFTNLSAWVGCDTKSIFKQSLTCFNSVFFFSYIGCLINV